MGRNRLMNLMMKILLPAFFIALKLTGSFIDFMLGLANSIDQDNINFITSQVKDSRTMNYDSKHHKHISCSEAFRYRKSYKTVVENSISLNDNSAVVDSLVSEGTYTIKNLLGKKTIESFSFRTCVKPKLSENRFGDTEIIYESLTAQDQLQTRAANSLKPISVF